MNDYKDNFYNNYNTSHILGRKGAPSIVEFKGRSRIYDKHFGKHLPKDKNVELVDIGCGNGSVVWWLQQKGYSKTIGIDISQEQIEAGKKLEVNNLIPSDIIKYLQNKNDKFDIIIARDVIEHFKKNETVELLNLCYQSLKNGGKILLQVPNGESPFFGRIRYGDFTHEIAFSQSSLQQLLKMSGFNKVECYSAEVIAVNIQSFLRLVVWKVFESIIRLILFSEVGKSQSKRIVTQNIIAVATKAD